MKMIHQVQMGEVTSSERVDIGYPMDFWEQEGLQLVSSSQTSNVSESWILDNTPLLAACEQDADLAWKYQISSQPTSINYYPQINDSQLIATMATGLSSLSDENLAQNLASITTAALSPVSIPPPSPNPVSEDIDIIMPDPQQNSQTIMAELDEVLDKDQPVAKTIQEIENWLRMSESSQGNGFLSQDPPKAAAPNEENGIEINEQIVETSNTITPARAAAVAKTSCKRKSGGGFENSSKKRNQNKEAARRYRDKKKTEAEQFSSRKEELLTENRRWKKELKSLNEKRKAYLQMIETRANAKTNPNFVVHFPSWHFS